MKTEAKVTKKSSPKKKKQTQTTGTGRHEGRKDDLSYRWSIFKSQARRRGTLVSLTILEYFTITLQQCDYCGGREGTSVLNGIDRVDSSGDYTVQNSAPCCKTCNFMKGAMTKRKFARHVTVIHKHMQNLSSS